MNTIHQREEELFDAARKIPDEAERARFLDRECAGDTALRSRLDNLLGAAVEAETFFAESESALTFTISPLNAGPLDNTGHGRRGVQLPAEEAVGSRIGRYRLVEKIGEGGCGAVYMAEQREPVRRVVALKIIRLGMETRSVISRFENERQALAMMDHPNIARVFDAGATERGSPYFVMELVRGQRITRYCDEHRLDLRQRLDLFVQICHAIQHAHQKGIIHRDIKPSNILVTVQDGTPVPKVIDFGIAKATEAQLTDRILFTGYAQLIGTPAYMSPEQAAMGGIDVDTRSDIYSLGVLLYELLTGRTPFDARALADAGLDDMRKTLREREPPRPSQRLQAFSVGELAEAAARRGCEPARLIALLQGDLDWIVMKALEKDRTRRYETANGLAMDVQRYLGNEPVTARPPSWIYRLEKLVLRNRVVFLAGGAVAAALVAGFCTSTWMFLREREARHRAVAAEQQQALLRQEAELRERITQAALLVSQGRHAEADVILNDISLNQPTVEGASVFRSVGEWHALQSHWKKAAERFGVLLHVNQLDGIDRETLDYLERGPVLIEAGDMAGYEQFRQGAIARFNQTASPFADRIVKISLLIPATPQTIDALAHAAEANAKAFAQADTAGDSFQAAWRALSLGLYEFRRGNYADAARWCRRTLAATDANAPRTATARIILAMSLHELGNKTAEAGRELALARELVEAKYRGRVDNGSPVQGFWFDWLFARVLLREAMGLIEGTQGDASSPEV